MYNDELRIKDRLEEILESIELIQEWSKGMTELHDFKRGFTQAEECNRGAS
jgi:hypothetical protein